MRSVTTWVDKVLDKGGVEQWYIVHLISKYFLNLNNKHNLLKIIVFF